MGEARSSAALIYFGNEISSVVGSRANTILYWRRRESSLYDEVWAIRRDGLHPWFCREAETFMVSLHVDRLFLSWAPYV